MTDQLSLAAEFEPATLDQWRRLALGVLRKSGVAAYMSSTPHRRANPSRQPRVFARVS